MTDYVFVLGKNWLLSIAELIVCLQNHGIKFSLKDHSRTTAIVTIQDKLAIEDIIDIQEMLGGCFKIGKVVTSYPRELIEGAFPRRRKVKKENRKKLQDCKWVDKVWRKPQNKKIKFGISTYPMLERATSIDLRRFTASMSTWVKKRLTSKGAKRAAYYSYDEPDKRDESRPNTALWPVSIARHGLLRPPNAEIIASSMQETLYISQTVVVYDSMLQQYRDESRPFVSAEISTSPKICRTLLNLAGVKRGDTVLDPFCGTGTLLMEAVMLGMRCIGVDINGEAIQGARKNIIWIAKELDQIADFQLIQGDSRNVSELVDRKVDGIAFEPELGPVYTSTPTYEEVRIIQKDLTELYQKVLSSLEKILNDDGRISMTLPVFQLKNREPMKIDTNQMLKGTHLEIIPLFPENIVTQSGTSDKRLVINPNRQRIPERKRGQAVQREVVMIGRS